MAHKKSSYLRRWIFVSQTLQLFAHIFILVDSDPEPQKVAEYGSNLDPDPQFWFKNTAAELPNVFLDVTGPSMSSCLLSTPSR